MEGWLREAANPAAELRQRESPRQDRLLVIIDALGVHTCRKWTRSIRYAFREKLEMGAWRVLVIQVQDWFPRSGT